jgi:hypothetical protein
MEPLVKCTPQYDEVLEISNILRENDWTHIDSHKGNFMCRPSTGAVVVIDFGWAVKKGDKNYKKHNWAKSYPDITYEQMQVFHDKLLSEQFIPFDYPNREKILKPLYIKYYKTLAELNKSKKKN